MKSYQNISGIIRDRCMKVAAVLVLLCCLSCARIERVYDEGDREISFNPTESVLTKISTYPEDESFGLFAYYSDCEGGIAWNDAAAWPVSVPYLENVAFRKNGTYWSGYDMDTSEVSPYYWPLSGCLMFAGYSPYGSETITSNVTLHNTLTSVINPYMVIQFTQNSEVDNMVDLLWFDVKDVSEGKTVAKTSEAIDIVFRHALSKVTFEFADLHDNYGLTEVSLKGCVNSATFYSGTNRGWLPQTDKLMNYSIYEHTSGSDVPLLNGWSSSELFIIPQYLDGVFPVVGTGSLDTGVDVVLSFTLTDGFGSQTVDVILHEYTDRWQIGYHYHYVVTINADPINFGTPSVSIITQTVAL